jgi:hypothetical protein
VGRGARSSALSLALLWAAAGTAGGASPGSTDELRLTTMRPGASTGVFATEIFNARYANGQIKPLRHSLIGFPKGTKLDALGAVTCNASEDDFSSKGMSACPGAAKIGAGNASVVTTGTPTQVGPVEVDLTVFARTDGSMFVFSQGDAYLSSMRIRVFKRRFQRADPEPMCFVVTEQPPCQHGEFVPRSLTVFIPPHSRVVNGRRHNLVTTPRRCPKSRRWKFFDKHTFDDGSFDLFVNHPRCRTKAFRPTRKRRVVNLVRPR